MSDSVIRRLFMLTTELAEEKDAARDMRKQRDEQRDISDKCCKLLREAIAAIDSCVELPGGWRDRAKAVVEQNEDLS